MKVDCKCDVNPTDWFWVDMRTERTCCESCGYEKIACNDDPGIELEVAYMLDCGCLASSLDAEFCDCG